MILKFILVVKYLGVWLHIEGESTPQFDNNGYVTGIDITLISDMRNYLQAAQRHNILVFFTLWNAAVKQNTHYRLHGLMVDTRKLQSYIDHALKPMANALKGEKALGGWDIMNEPEGEIKTGLSNADPCFDTRHLSGSGAGWAGQLYTPQEIARFKYHIFKESSFRSANSSKPVKIFTNITFIYPITRNNIDCMPERHNISTF